MTVITNQLILFNRSCRETLLTQTHESESTELISKETNCSVEEILMITVLSVNNFKIEDQTNPSNWQLCCC